MILKAINMNPLVKNPQNTIPVHEILMHRVRSVMGLNLSAKTR